MRRTIIVASGKKFNPGIKPINIMRIILCIAQRKSARSIIEDLVIIHKKSIVVKIIVAIQPNRPILITSMPSFVSATKSIMNGKGGICGAS